MTLSIWTNWDPLEEVIVGDCYSPGDFDHFIDQDIQDDFNKILQDTKEDFDNLDKTLKNLGVKVHRPDVKIYPKQINMGDFNIQMPMPPAIPRDQYLVYGDTIIQTYTSMPDRYFDSRSYYDIFRSLYDSGYNWISQPPPNLTNIKELPQWWSDGGKIYNLLENQVLWHAATMFKCGDAIIINSKGPGSQRGLEWMRRNLPDTKIIENSNTYHDNWGHIDHGFFMINDETVICIDKSFVPECLRNKKLIEFGKFYYKSNPNKNSTDYRAQLKVNSDSHYGKERLKNYISEWTGYEQPTFFDTNVLVVDSENIITSAIPSSMIKLLETQKINVHICPQRHGLFWDSGIHCATLDIRRRGEQRRVI